MRRDQRSPAVVAIGIALSVALPLLTQLAACTKAPEPRALPEIQKRGELRVVTVNRSTTYYLGAHGAEGLEFSLARDYAQRLGVTLVITPLPHAAAMQAELAAGRADIAAAQLSADEAWLQAADAAEPYEEVEQLVVYRRGEKRPRGTIQLESARLAVRAGSPQEQVLKKMKATVAPNLEWVVTAPSSADPLEDVQTGQANYAIVDSREYSFARHLYPNVVVGFTLPASRPAQWLVRKNARDLVRSVNDFFERPARFGPARAALATVDGRCASVRVSRIEAVSGPHRRSAGQLPAVLRRSLNRERRGLAPARRHRLPGVEVESDGRIA